MSNPTFSVVIPTYNRAALVAEAIDSVLAQTDADFEVVVVDDGSTDRTPQVLRTYGDRIRVVRQANRGLAAARNAGVAAASGTVVGFLDSDDLFEPRLLERVRATLAEFPDAGAVFIAERRFVRRDQVGNRIDSKRTPGPFFSTAGLISLDTGVGAGRPPFVRRSWLERLGGFDEQIRCAVDCEMWIRYSFEVVMVFLAEPLILRRAHDDNLSGNRAQDARDWLLILERLRAAHPEFVRRHPLTYRRALGKQRLRLGRELLARLGSDAAGRAESRHFLWAAILAWPIFVRAWLYLAWSLVLPSSYGRWARAERRYAVSRRNA